MGIFAATRTPGRGMVFSAGAILSYLQGWAGFLVVLIRDLFKPGLLHQVQRNLLIFWL